MFIKNDWKLIVPLLLPLFVLVLVWSVSAQFTPTPTNMITVRSLVDNIDYSDGVCTLREAIESANTDTPIGGCVTGRGTDMILFEITGVITLNGNPLILNSDIVIDGQNNITVHGNYENRVFQVKPNSTVGLYNLSITGGFNPDGLSNAGAILNEGDMLFDGVTLSDNRIAYGNGGGLYNVNGSVQFINSHLEFNTTSEAGSGGAIYNFKGDVTVQDSVFVTNLTAGHGGAIANEQGSLTVINTTFDGNRADYGGAISHYSSLVETNVTITDSLFDGNLAIQHGGALHYVNENFTGTLSVNNTDVLTNGAIVDGGGFYIDGARTTVEINDSQFAFNAADAFEESEEIIGDGGGLFLTSDTNADETGTVTINRTVIKENRADNGGGIYNDGFDLFIDDNTIQQNTVTTQGGGIFVNTLDGSPVGKQLQIDNSLIAENEALIAGGISAISATVTITHSDVLTNVGGGLAHVGGDTTVINSLFDRNLQNFNQHGGAIAHRNGDLLVEGSTFVHNWGGVGGGAIDFSGGTVRVIDSVLSENATEGSGGAIAIIDESSHLYISQSTVSDNFSYNHAGGILAAYGGKITMEDTTVASNISERNGGGIYAQTIDLSITDSRIIDNWAAGLHAQHSSEGSGGGLHATRGTIVRTEIAHNKAMTYGGAIDASGHITLVNSTVSGNTAENAIHTPNLTAIHTTIYTNTGVGIAVSGQLDLQNSIVSRNSGGDCDIDGANVIIPPLPDRMPNLDSDSSCNVLYTELMPLEPLDYNGGETRTHAFAAGFALNAGHSDSCAHPLIEGIDQRGVERPQDRACELGAYEYIHDDPPLAVTNFTDGDVIDYDLPLLIGDAYGLPHIAGHPGVWIEVGSEMYWFSINSGRWRGYVPLEIGTNELTITDSRDSMTFNLTYVPSTNEKKVRLVYMLGSDSDGSFDVPDVPNTMDDAVQRIKLAGRLIQSAAAELLHEKGLTRETFTLIKDENGEPVVDIERSSLTKAEIRSMDGQALWSTFYEELSDYPDRDNVIDIVIIADTHYDEATGTVQGHAAIGGGRLALFGSGTLHTFPEYAFGIEGHFGNPRKIESHLFPEVARTNEYWSIFTTSIGAMLHEVGLCLGLNQPAPYVEGAIMSRGFDYLNRLSMTTEPHFGEIDHTTATMPFWTDENASLLMSNAWFGAVELELDESVYLPMLLIR